MKIVVHLTSSEGEQALHSAFMAIGTVSYTHLTLPTNREV